ncbi:hypothetical protein TVAG_166160 [Trichomonas vaginalis G3]|uniref:Uncharacterized protein n=1 Tax=Trichomonas vaginalis (strain ATCC PRA-98 / G3) TaxID=412133 RepID=A2DE23_TRIV3|nr:biological adhesion protein [Trichomonas vaginalis G3]EAY21241.1 hypothetical protein TVAG_166160 [Trichomonas vaginalis G3]KAI5548804.1 biological adhesion protein [Trichomonas vaginalis G3]|eukprot:XP_001582227.1 hypothetical protein [Trichomonas vaginalis G3]
MDSHEIREENRVLRLRLTDAEEKLRLLADALEKRNEQARVWTQRCNDLEDQLRIAQDAIDQQESEILKKESIIEKLRQMLEQMKKDQILQQNFQSDEAKKLQNDIEQQHKKFLETLNQLNQAKGPAKTSFELQNELIAKKEKQLEDLKKQLQDALEAKEAADQSLEDSEAQCEKLSHERDTFLRLNEELMEALREAKSGKAELAEIEKLKAQIDKEYQKVLALHRQRKQLKNVILQLKQALEGKEAQIQDLLNEQRGYQEKALESDGRIRELNKKIDDLKGAISKIRSEERAYKERAEAAEKKADDLQKNVRTLIDEKQKLAEDRNIRAQKQIIKQKNGKIDAGNIKELQLRVRQEMEKRLDAQEEAANLKDELMEIKRQNALLQEQANDAIGADLQPLIELLKDLRVEAVAVDQDLLNLIDEIPPAKELVFPEIPPGICESAATLISNVAMQFQDSQIENRELRLLVNKFARTASIYHRISTVIAKYPILSADDIATQEDRGNWVLPIETEHLQRTIVKLHELLVRRGRSDN